MNKKGYYFTLDAFIAIVILGAGFLLIQSTSLIAPQSAVVEHFSDDVLNILNTAKSDEFFVLTNNNENTLLEVIGERYSFGNISGAKEIVSKYIIDTGIVVDNYNFSLYVNDSLIYPSFEPDTSKTKVLISSKRIVFGYFEDSLTGFISFWGPYDVEVKSWQEE